MLIRLLSPLTALSSRDNQTYLARCRRVPRIDSHVNTSNANRQWLAQTQDPSELLPIERGVLPFAAHASGFA